jgi:hypothetical protein
MASLVDTLAQIDEARHAIRAGQKRRAFPGATSAQLAELSATLPALPPELAIWFQWHNGLDELFPRSSARQLSIKEAIDAIGHFEQKNPFAGAAFFLPLTDTQAGQYDVFLSGGTIAFWDRDELGAPVPFTQWVEGLLAEWKSQNKLIHARWMRLARVFTGGQELSGPSALRKKTLGAFEELAEGEAFSISAPGMTVVFEPAEATSVKIDEDGDAFAAARRIVISLAAADIDGLIAGLKSAQPSITTESLGGWSLIFSDR